MSALDGFLAAWSNAKATFGEGIPQGGAQFDQSAALDQMHSTLASAAPGSRWTGGAASAYDAANTEHRRVVGELGGLDKRLAGHVDQSAQVVADGRRDLDAVRKWVVDAAASVPNNAAGDRMLVPIVNKGIGQVRDIVQTANGDLGAIGTKIRALGDEYTALGNQKFAKEAGGDQIGLPDPTTAAEQDVQDALSGDETAAARVDHVLDSIKPGQPMNAEQGSYLSQMQAQMHGMSVERLHEVEGKLGDHKDIVGDAMQLMSNDDVTYPKTELEVDALDDPSQTVRGGLDKLPQSVQDTLNETGVNRLDRLQSVAEIVRDGDDGLQRNTDLDRGLLKRAADVMESPFWQQGPEEYPGGSMDRGISAFDPTVSTVFDAVSPDHGAIHDAITTGPGHIDGIDADKFMEGVTHRNWADDGKAAGELFEWTKNNTGPESELAGTTAHAYAQYLGEHSSDLLRLGGFHQIGDVNPSLVQSFAAGLTPYQEEMVDAHPLVDTSFTKLDGLGSDMATTKGLFAVIDSQPDAARDFNRAAYENAMNMQTSFADLAHENPKLTGGDTRLDDLESSARLLGVIDGGINQETLSNVNNGHMSQADAFKNASDAYEFKKGILGDALSYGPGGDLITNSAAEIIAGPPPNENDYVFDDQTGMVTDVGLTPTEDSQRHQVTQAQYTVASQFIDHGNPYVHPKFFDENGSLKPPSHISEDDWSDYDAQLTVAMSRQLEINTMLGKFRDTLEQVNGT